MKLNVERSFDHRKELSGAGGVIRNNKENWVVDFSIKKSAQNATQAKIIALYHGLQLVAIRQLRNIKIVTDSESTSNILVEKNEEYSNIIYDCRELLLRLGNPMLNLNHRRQNQVADLLANKGTQQGGNGEIIIWDTVPPFEYEAMEVDKGIKSIDSMIRTPVILKLLATLYLVLVLLIPLLVDLYQPNCIDAL